LSRKEEPFRPSPFFFLPLGRGRRVPLEKGQKKARALKRKTCPSAGKSRSDRPFEIRKNSTVLPIYSNDKARGLTFTPKKITMIIAKYLHI